MSCNCTARQSPHIPYFKISLTCRSILHFRRRSPMTRDAAGAHVFNREIYCSIDRIIRIRQLYSDKTHLYGLNVVRQSNNHDYN